jgi:hypothetical protein
MTLNTLTYTNSHDYVLRKHAGHKYTQRHQKSSMSISSYPTHLLNAYPIDCFLDTIFHILVKLIILLRNSIIIRQLIYVGKVGHRQTTALVGVAFKAMIVGFIDIFFGIVVLVVTIVCCFGGFRCWSDIVELLRFGVASLFDVFRLRMLLLQCNIVMQLNTIRGWFDSSNTP